jgi:hypothetical protein
MSSPDKPYYIRNASGNEAIPLSNESDLADLKRQLEYRGTREAIQVSQKAVAGIAAGVPLAKAIDGREVFDIIARGNAEFQAKTGRPITYSEMRELYG